MEALLSYFGANRQITWTFVAFAKVVAISICISCATSLDAAEYRTPNFVIKNAPSYDLAKQFGETAEQLRKDMAILWLGHELPQWFAPCPVIVKVGNFKPGGETSMQFKDGEVFDWDMRIQGSAESILTAVLPHEITHTVLHSHFRLPPPRWFDEGAATLVENDKERENYRRLLYQYLRTGRGIPFNPMFRMSEYPEDQMPFYAQVFSLAEFLIMQQGHRHYVDFATSGMKTLNWPQAMRDYYGYENLGELQVKWNTWVEAGCPDLNRHPQDEPILVGTSTQYIASRDFLPLRQPTILSRSISNANTVASQNVIPVAYISAQPMQQTQQSIAEEIPLQPEREPLRLSVSQNQQSLQLAASFAPIPETGSTMQMPGYDVPQAILAQPVVSPSAMSPGMSRVVASPVLSQQNPNTIPESRLPSYFTENQPVAGQQLYQSSRNIQNPSQSDNDSRVIMNWNSTIR